MPLNKAMIEVLHVPVINTTQVDMVKENRRESGSVEDVYSIESIYEGSEDGFAAVDRAQTADAEAIITRVPMEVAMVDTSELNDLSKCEYSLDSYEKSLFKKQAQTLQQARRQKMRKQYASPDSKLVLISSPEQEES